MVRYWRFAGRSLRAGLIAAAALAAFAIASPSALAQSGPAGITCPETNSTPAFTSGGSLFGRIASQWNAYFGAKVDVNNGVLCSPKIWPFIQNSQLALMPPDTIKSNPLDIAAQPQDLAIPNCPDSGGNHINWNHGVGWACGTTGGGGSGCTVAGGTEWQVLIDNAAGGCTDSTLRDDGVNISATLTPTAGSSSNVLLIDPTNNNVYLGYIAGDGAVASTDQVAVGDQALLNASGNTNVVGIGNGTGNGAVNSTELILMGTGAGAGATTVQIGNIIGIGNGAAGNMTGTSTSSQQVSDIVAVGNGAFGGLTNPAGHFVNDIVAIGDGAAGSVDATTGDVDDLVAIGLLAADSIIEPHNVIALGNRAAQFVTAPIGGVVAIGAAPLQYAQFVNADANGVNAVAIGTHTGINLGATGTPANNFILMGYEAGEGIGGTATQDVVGIGRSAAFGDEGSTVVAVGNGTASGNTGNSVIAIGDATGSNNSGSSDVFIGDGGTGVSNGNNDVIAIGDGTGQRNAAPDVVAIGDNTLNDNLANTVVAIGKDTANSNGGGPLVAIGFGAANFNTVTGSMVAIGDNAGAGSAGEANVFIGQSAGAASTGTGETIAIGTAALDTNTGHFVTALGTGAGDGNTGNNVFIVAGGDRGGMVNNTGSDVISIGQRVAGCLTPSSTGSNFIAITNALPCNTTASNSLDLAEVITTTGIDTPATSITSIAGRLQDSHLTSAANCSGQPSGEIISTTGTGVLVQCP